MQIKVPMIIARALDRFHEWGYAPIWSWRWITVRRVDPLIAIAAAICFGYYTWSGGVMAGITGLLMFILIAMIVLWF